MSETDGGSSGTQASGRLYDAAGQPIWKGGEQGEAAVEDLVRFARQQPVATALVTFMLGYILGKLL
jgi:ABC-type cobalt transport system substrate-binding protein